MLVMKYHRNIGTIGTRRIVLFNYVSTSKLLIHIYLMFL